MICKFRVLLREVDAQRNRRAEAWLIAVKEFIIP